ncbi:choice-of-anchor A family protein [Govanella unica]|uniref:Choice-of-anchor A family protein n=1 Tax=Govanella unica TaxID=2975056 RepID=A0A9X3TZE3_9PROT|nr:choice-of-anchor A family protein [Govania unica]MDA5194257.1 choice-of-anchor A family protein [Govania unica]
MPRFLNLFICAFLTVAGLTLGATPSLAGPLTAAEVLSQFNVVTFGNLNAFSEIQGRTLVTGNLGGKLSTYYTRPSEVNASNYGALTVGGKVTGALKTIDGNGDAYIAGNAQNMHMNGGTAYIKGTVISNVTGNQQIVPAVDVPNFKPVMDQLSTDLKGLATTSTVTISGKRATFTATPGADGQAVFSIPNGDAFFKSTNEITFVLGGANSFIINVGGSSMTVIENFLDGIGATIAPMAIWNFYDATSLNFNREFYGTVLAPNATISNIFALNGSVIAKDFTPLGAVHLASYSGPLPSGPKAEIPAPQSAALVGLALLALCTIRRRRT